MTEILQEAERVDREEDERHGEARGDELPEQLRTREGRRAALKAAREKLERERAAAAEAGQEVIARIEVDLDPDRFEVRPEGRRAWLREARRDLEVAFWWVRSLVRLWVIICRRHSVRTALRPRRWKRLNFRLCLV